MLHYQLYRKGKWLGEVKKCVQCHTDPSILIQNSYSFHSVLLSMVSAKLSVCFSLKEYLSAQHVCT